ncbi:MAG: YHS domain-containing (seleno)protein [Hyphococcus sp.]
MTGFIRKEVSMCVTAALVSAAFIGAQAAAQQTVGFMPASVQSEIAAASLSEERLYLSVDHLTLFHTEDLPDYIVNDHETGVAISGFDPVSYFHEGQPQRGQPDLKAVYHGAVFLFSNVDHLRAFQRAPEQYAPAFGGHDPEAVATGSYLPANPLQWTIYENRLYLSANEELARRFRTHEAEVIETAASRWHDVEHHYERDARSFWAHKEGFRACRARKAGESCGAASPAFASF